MKLLFLPVLALLAGCQTAPPYDNASQVLERNGFTKINSMAQAKVGTVVKNVNDQIPELFDALSHSAIISNTAVAPSCSLGVENGAFLPSQTIRIDVEESGLGVISYLGKKIYFSSPDFSLACARAFEMSRTVVH